MLDIPRHLAIRRNFSKKKIIDNEKRSTKLILKYLMSLRIVFSGTYCLSISCFHMECDFGICSVSTKKHKKIIIFSFKLILVFTHVYSECLLAAAGRQIRFLKCSISGLQLTGSCCIQFFF